MKEISTFISNLPRLSTLNALKSVLEEFCRRLNFLYYSYVGCCFSQNSSEQVSISNYPAEWIRLCKEMNFSVIDPVLTQTRSRILPLIWVLNDNKEDHLRDFLSMSQNFDTRGEGVSVPVRGPNGDKGLLSLVIRPNSKAEIDNIKNMIPELIYFSQIVHANVVEQFGGDRHNLDGLTPREFDVLKWASLGKTAWETGIIMGLSERTITFYVQNACRRLGVRTKIEAVAVYSSKFRNP